MIETMQLKSLKTSVKDIMGLEFEIPSSILPRCHDRGKRGEGVVDKNDG